MYYLFRDLAQILTLSFIHSLLKSFSQVDQVQIVKWHMMSITTEDEQESIFAHIGCMALSGIGLNSSHNTEV